MIYSRLLEYSDTEVKNEKTGENKGINKKEYKIEKALNFSIKSSYNNLNNLTKGKIVINKNYKIEIKNLIQNYIKEKTKNPTNSFDYLVKKYDNNYQEKSEDQFTFYNGSPKKTEKSQI